MRDTWSNLYTQVMGISKPWHVSEVKLDVSGEQVDVWVQHEEGRKWECPECGKSCALFDHSETRTWRHLDTCQFKTYLHARPPRVKCDEHGVKQAALPWSEPMSRFTALFERLAIDVLQQTSVTGAMRILKISWDQAWHIMDRAVARGLARKKDRVIARIGVDEKAVAKGHTYFTMVHDLDRGVVEYIAEDRKQSSLNGYFEGRSGEQLAGIKAVAMDMWEPYIQSVIQHVPWAQEKIVFDRYHIMTHMGNAVDKVRKKEHRELLAIDDQALKGTKYFWLYSRENLPARHRDRFESLKDQNLQTGRAWAIKESLRELWSYRYKGAAFKYWKKWHAWAMRSKLEPVKAAARMIKSHIENILTYCEHQITNACSEGINSKIQTIKKMAYGFRNKEHFKTAIFFKCGGLQLYPSTHGIPG
jgi:transposase